MTVGRVYLIGAGPGDPELLTVKAARVLKDVDVVVFDRLVSPEILEQVPAGTTRVYAGKGPRNHHLTQVEINELLCTLARSGRSVARVKGGDPFVFGRGSEEAEHLAQNGIPYEIVPGVTAASGGSAYAGIPLTHRGLATGVRYVTGHLREDMVLDHDWHSMADPNTTLVVYMGLNSFHEIAQHLMEAGLPSDTPAAAIQNATTSRQRRVIGTLSDLPRLVDEANLSAPTIFVIGRVVSLAGTLDWFQPQAEADLVMVTDETAIG